MRALILPLSLLGLLGCASMTPTVTSNGEALLLWSSEQESGTFEKEKVGELHFEDENGGDLGKADIYSEVEKTAHWTEWGCAQGARLLSDLDCLLIAGDEEAAATVAAQENLEAALSWGGLAAMVVGGVALLPGFFLVGNEEQNTKMLGLVAVTSGLVGLGGGMAAAFAIAPMLPTHPVDATRMQQAIDRYNTRVGRRSNGP